MQFITISFEGIEGTIDIATKSVALHYGCNTNRVS
jgi:hypothetical protein